MQYHSVCLELGLKTSGRSAWIQSAQLKNMSYALIVP